MSPLLIWYEGFGGVWLLVKFVYSFTYTNLVLAIMVGLILILLLLGGKVLLSKGKAMKA